MRYVKSIAPAGLQHYITDETPVHFKSFGNDLIAFFHDFDDLFLKTDRRIFTNYIIFQYVSNRQALHIEHEEPSLNKSRDCAKLVKALMKQATGTIFVRVHFSEVFLYD